ncbi:MAG TPA: Fic family protein, partial [Bacteroidota bacterium]
MSKKKHKVSAKYHTDQTSEYESGSRGKVLKNLLGISSVSRMREQEFSGYLHAEREMTARFGKHHRFSVNDIHSIHRMFLGAIYDWAGTPRTVNISKGGFPFATALALPQALELFERNFLHRFTPCLQNEPDDVALSIAKVQVEFLLLHPYREGNGRTARL